MRAEAGRVVLRRRVELLEHLFDGVNGPNL
jgi:hypothetical protein